MKSNQKLRSRKVGGITFFLSEALICFFLMKSNRCVWVIFDEYIV